MLCNWKEEEIVNLKWVDLRNKTMSFPTVYKWSFLSPNLIKSSFTSNSYFVSINSVRIIRNYRVVTIQMKLVLNYLSTAEETDASEVVLDAFTHSLMKLRCHKCITLQHFKCINNFIRLMFYFFFLNTNKCWKNAMILLNITKPPVGQQQMSVLMSKSFIN